VPPEMGANFSLNWENNEMQRSRSGLDCEETKARTMVGTSVNRSDSAGQVFENVERVDASVLRAVLWIMYRFV